MAMFEFKDSKNIKIDNCETTSEKIMFGDNVDDVTVKNSRAGGKKVTQDLETVPAYRRFFSGIRKLTWLLVTGIVFPTVATIAAYLLGFGGS